jgi:acetylornithine deacetylase/succinyl-diaminopimelate desuccinylase-like protein
MSAASLSDHFAAKREEYLRDFAEFLAFKSISSDDAFREDCLKCAKWLEDFLAKLGFKTELIGEANEINPIVYAELIKNDSSQTILYYGHYDVQPVDPVAMWSSDPFKATVRFDQKTGLERVYARGAQDNKGQTFAFLKALEYLIERGELKCSVKILIEGGEEVGSPKIAEIVQNNLEKFKANTLLVCDTGSTSIDTPTIVLGLRGVCSLELVVHGPPKDLHSGIHGGVAANPAQVLSKILANLHDANGAVTIPGFYEDVQVLSSEEQVLLITNSLSKEEYQEIVGYPANGGEKAFSIGERCGVRPTIEINGLTSGYQGPKVKTIIPSYATVKLSSRIVAGQCPKKVLSLIEQHFRTHLPDGMRLEVLSPESGGKALLISYDAQPIKIATEILTEHFSNAVKFRWEGASIPVLAEMVDKLKLEPLLVGFGLEEDNIHAPNESFSLKQLEQGFSFCSEFLSSF